MTTSADALSAIVLCGVLGAVGQGVRAVVGLKNNRTAASSTPDQQTAFSAAYLAISLMIGAVAGILAGFALGLAKFATIDLDDTKMLLGIAAAGYTGADFVENTMSLVIPARGLDGPRTPEWSAQTFRAETSALGTEVITPPSPPPVVRAPVGVTAAELGAALLAVAPKIRGAVWIPSLQAGFAKYGVGTERRVAVALGQFLVEAGSAFQEIIENLRYTTAARIVHIFHKEIPDETTAAAYVDNPEKLANRVYANRNGNADEASGDGYRFRGRGLIQLTGRREYEQFGKTIGMTAEEAAAYCETPEGAAMSGCWYLATRACLPDADAWRIDNVTRKVNGVGMVDAELRAHYSQRILKVLGTADA